MNRFFYNAAALLFLLCLSGCRTLPANDVRYTTAIVVIIAIIALFFVLARYSNILRDEVSDCDEFNKNAQQLQRKQKSRFVDKSLPYSLTKVQFGIWTVIISSSYTYLSLCKGDCSDGPINKTALILMGIYAGTTAAAAIIDKREISDNRPRHQNSPSEGFFVDILSDDNGISLHRFQNLVWTIIAIIVYLYKVSMIRTGCILPELSDTLLALTGISSATYLVLRSKENDPPIQAVQETSLTNGVDANKIGEKNTALTT